MLIAGIASSIFSQLSSVQSKPETLQSEFQQLAQDLQAGNLTQAQTDFATLQKSAPASLAASRSPLSQAISALGQDLQAGNLQGAQQDFAAVEQAAQQSGQVHHHHHHAAKPQSNDSTQQENSLAQLFNILGQDLQSGNLAGAQQAYAGLVQDLQPFAASGTSLAAPASASSLNLSA